METDRFYSFRRSKTFLAQNVLLTLVLILLVFGISGFWIAFLQRAAEKLLGVERLSFFDNFVITLILLGLLFIILLGVFSARRENTLLF